MLKFGGEQVISWFTFFSGIRTFSNSLEAVLTTMALYFWPITLGKYHTANRPLGLVLAGATVVVKLLSLALRLMIQTFHTFLVRLLRMPSVNS